MIYLDHAATTAVFPEVLEAMLPWFQLDHVGNASSIHTQGVNASQAIENAREQVAKMINADTSEIFFTSGGTESNNTFARYVMGEQVITTRLEHHSVPHPLEEWAHEVTYVKNLSDGSVDMDDLRHLLDSSCYQAVSVMWVNNELGTINPIEEIAMLCKKHRLSFHVDAVQAAGHIPIDVKKCGMDFLSMSGHKFGAPPGVGVLYVRNGVSKRALIGGGGQEHGMRAGTYNVPGIVGLGKAAEIIIHRLPRQIQKWNSQEYVLLKELDKVMPGEYRQNAADLRTHNIISITIPGVNSEALLLLLDQKEIYLSAGSACSASDSVPSHVLKGIGLSDEDAASTVRISLGYDNTANDMVDTAQAIAEAVHRLKTMYP
mgnify:FL=1